MQLVNTFSVLFLSSMNSQLSTLAIEYRAMQKKSRLYWEKREKNGLNCLSTALFELQCYVALLWWWRIGGVGAFCSVIDCSLAGPGRLRKWWLHRAITHTWHTHPGQGWGWSRLIRRPTRNIQHYSIQTLFYTPSDRRTGRQTCFSWTLDMSYGGGWTMITYRVYWTRIMELNMAQWRILTIVTTLNVSDEVDSRVSDSVSDSLSVPSLWWISPIDHNGLEHKVNMTHDSKHGQ